MRIEELYKDEHLYFKEKYEEVKNPRHYRGDGRIECQDAMHSMLAGWEANRCIPYSAAYWITCAFKYIWRWCLKGDHMSNIDKAITCLQYAKRELGGGSHA